jgi:hypothetical protein
MASADALLDARRDAVTPHAPRRSAILPDRIDGGPLSDAEIDRRLVRCGRARRRPSRMGGPIASSYGSIPVWVDERFPATEPSFDAVRGRTSSRCASARSAGARAHLVAPLGASPPSGG